jgi:NAD(P)H-dependent FMN reductase
MLSIVAIVGSLRKDSLNLKLTKAAAELAPPGMVVQMETLHGIPLYDGDLEASEGLPKRVVELKNQISAASGLLIVTPEYNNSMPGVLKNAIDWLSRPPADITRVFRDRPVGLIGASPGMGGTRFAQTSWLQVFRTLGVRPFFGKSVYVAGAGKVFSDHGAILDSKVTELLREYMAEFAAFVTAEHAAAPS